MRKRSLLTRCRARGDGLRQRAHRADVVHGPATLANARREQVSFSHDNLDQAFEIASIVARVTLSAHEQQRLKREIADAMWPEPDAPRELHNEVVLITGHRL